MSYILCFRHWPMPRPMKALAANAAFTILSICIAIFSELWTCTLRALHVKAKVLFYYLELPEFNWPKCVASHLAGLNSICRHSVKLCNWPVSCCIVQLPYPYDSTNTCECTNQTMYVLIQVIFVYCKQRRPQFQSLQCTIRFRLSVRKASTHYYYSA